MTTILNHTPGQRVTFFQEIKDGYGVRTDDGYIPVVTRIVTPTFTLASGYPQVMIRLDTGLYYFQFTIPSGAASVGSYLADVAYLNPVNGRIINDIFQIVVTAPFGNFGITVGVP